MSALPKLPLTGTTCIFGRSEWGKSTLAQKMLADASPPQAVIIDPMAPGGTDAPGALKALEAGEASIIVNDNRRAHQIGAILYALAYSRPDRPAYVVADEAPGYLGQPMPGLQKAVLQGRHAGFGMMILAQRPAAVFAEYRTQAKLTLWLSLMDHTDLETARKVIGPDNASKLPGFAPGEYLQWPPLSGAEKPRKATK